MKALVVYTCTNILRDGKIEVFNSLAHFSGDNPTESEILSFEERHSEYPNRCSPKIINIIKLNE